MMGAGRAAAAAAMAAPAAVLLLLLIAGGAYAECYNYCFNDCMRWFKNMRDYCSYACDKVCTPDADATALHQRPLAVAVAGPGPAALSLSDSDHHHPWDKTQDAVRPAALPDHHPFHETHGHGAVVEPDDPGHGVVRPARVPVLP